MEYNGVTYKIGNGATREATQETSKQDEIHRLCAIAAVALCCSSKEKDTVHAAIGMPVNEWENVGKRMDFKDYIFPNGEIHVRMKVAPDAPILDKVFTIDSTHVYPETQGALFIGDDISLEKVGVIDLGHKNNNCTIWEQAELLHKYSVTGNLGEENFPLILQGYLQKNLRSVMKIQSYICSLDQRISVICIQTVTMKRLKKK